MSIREQTRRRPQCPPGGLLRPALDDKSPFAGQVDVEIVYRNDVGVLLIAEVGIELPGGGPGFADSRLGGDGEGLRAIFQESGDAVVLRHFGVGRGKGKEERGRMKAARRQV